jgi:hypothetical protein
MPANGPYHEPDEFTQHHIYTKVLQVVSSLNIFRAEGIN